MSKGGAAWRAACADGLPSAPVLLDADTVESLVHHVDVRSVMRELFAELGAARAVQPAQTLTPFPGGHGDFITYQGVLGGRGVFGAKLSPYIVRPEGALVTAWTLLMSLDTGRPLALCDAGSLTIERTAATTALAVDLLARPDAERLAVVGTGTIGIAHVRHVRGLRSWREILVASRRLSVDAERHAALSALDSRVMLADDVSSAVDGADVVLLCTSSGVPVIDPASLSRPALITSISTNVADAHEVPPEALAGMDVYCDHRASTPSSAGEMRLAAARHGWSPRAIRGDLAELVTGGAPRAGYERHAFFRSIGLGLEDIAVAAAIYDLWTASERAA